MGIRAQVLLFFSVLELNKNFCIYTPVNVEKQAQLMCQFKVESCKERVNFADTVLNQLF